MNVNTTNLSLLSVASCHELLCSSEDRGITNHFLNMYNKFLNNFFLNMYLIEMPLSIKDFMLGINKDLKELIAFIFETLINFKFLI